VTIETALARLGVYGGGVLVTKGAGETWTIETQINLTVDNIHWKHDRSLTIKAPASVAWSMVQQEANNYVVEDLRLDGTKASAAAPGSNHGYEMHLLNTALWGCKLIRPYFHDIDQFGFESHGSSGYPSSDIIVKDGRFIDCGWNGPSFNQVSYQVRCIGNYVSGSSDVGISVNNTGAAGLRCNDVIIANNTVLDIDGTDGSVDSHYGIAIEGDGHIGVIIEGNTIRNCDTRGISLQSASILPKAVDNQLYNCGNLNGTHTHGIIAQADVIGPKIMDNDLYNCAYDEGSAIRTYANGSKIIGNTDFIDQAVVVRHYGVHIDAAAGCKVQDNDIISLVLVVTKWRFR